MKNHLILFIVLLLVVSLSGCSGLTGKITADVCDAECQQEKDDYIQNINSFLAQAQKITAKVEDWKSITRKDLEDIIALRDQVKLLEIPKDFDMVNDYYQKVFDHYVEAVDYALKANEEYIFAYDASDLQSRNMAMSKVVYNVQEANKLLIYADEELKFATRLISKD